MDCYIFRSSNRNSTVPGKLFPPSSALPSLRPLADFMYNCVMGKQRYYVVWKGRKRGIFTSWAECEKHVKGYVGAQYKAFDSRPEAEQAFAGEYQSYKARPSSSGKWRTARVKPALPALCVDAACSGAPGPVEYRGVDLGTGNELFRAGPFPCGTNNVGEFLAIVHALTWLAKQKTRMPVYSDSENAIAWVKAGQARTKLKRQAENVALFVMIHSAENWLAENELSEGAVLKWDTSLWGENPADFGRK
jgi:ribonuclease HI